MAALLALAILLLAVFAVWSHLTYRRLQAAVTRLERALTERTEAAQVARAKATAPLQALHPITTQLITELEPLATWAPNWEAVPTPFLLVQDDLIRLADAAQPCDPALRLHAASALDSLAHVLTLMRGPHLPSDSLPPVSNITERIQLRVHAQYAHRDAMSLLSALERAEAGFYAPTAV